MCCFSGSVRNVSRTRIFARRTDADTQFLAYQMRYESDVPNAMILPLPVATPAREDSVRFIDLSDYKELFRDLARGFPALRQSVMPPSRAVLADNEVARLVVHEVGDFVASFVPTLDDFDRLDPRFVIPKETWLKIPAYTDYGFAVFQLKEGAVEPQPMAFEFETRMDDVFFPTVHIHDGEVHAKEEFEHDLYLQHAGFDSIVGRYKNRDVVDRASGLERSRYVASEFCKIEKTKGLVESDLLVHRQQVHGRFENADITFSAPGSRTVPSFNYRQLHPAWTWSATGAILAAPVAWLFARRSRLRQEKQDALPRT